MYINIAEGPQAHWIHVQEVVIDFSNESIRVRVDGRASLLPIRLFNQIQTDEQMIQMLNDARTKGFFPPITYEKPS